MVGGTEAYRRKWGVSPLQRDILLRMKKTGEMSYRGAGGNGGVQQMHRLKDKGLVDVFPGELPRWRLTEAGRQLINRW